MNVNGVMVYRVIPIEESDGIHIGDTIPIPEANEQFQCSDNKKNAENLFEDYRAREFPAFPSRKSCLFVLPQDIEFVDRWVKAHHPHDDWTYVLLTLQLKGQLLWCDEDHFTKAGLPLPPVFKESEAREYWTKAGNDYTTFEIPEGLFIGKATIKNIEQLEHKGIK